MRLVCDMVIRVLRLRVKYNNPQLQLHACPAANKLTLFILILTSK